MTVHMPAPYPTPPGFGNCASCPYFAIKQLAVCDVCTAATLPLARPYFCIHCGQQLDRADSHCRNQLCSEARWYDFNRAIAMKTGALDVAIASHKYEGAWTWGIVFARIVLSYLNAQPELAASDLIIPMPSVPLPAGTPTAGHDHAAWILESAAAQAPTPGFPFRVEPRVIVKTVETPKMAKTTSVAGRIVNANKIYDSLSVTDSGAIYGATVLVFDDVFTTGRTLNMVARRLREAGARRVLGLTLSRQPWW